MHNLLNNINIHKSAGPNKINAIVFKEIIEVTAPAIFVVPCRVVLFTKTGSKQM